MRLTLITIGSLCAIAAIACRKKEWKFEELVTPPPASYTDHMVLECSISDDGAIAGKITSDGRFALVDVQGKRSIWKRKVPAGSIHALSIDPAGTTLAYSRNCRELVVEDTRGVRQATYDFPGTCLDVHALAMAAGGYPIALGACGRGIYSIPVAHGSVTPIRQTVHCESELDGVQSLSVDDNGRWIVVGWMYGADRINHGFPAPSERHRADWWHETGKGKGIGVTVFDVKTSSVIAELEGEQASATGISPDGKWMAVGGNGVALWRMSDGTRVWWANRLDAGDATDFLENGRFVVGLSFGPTSTPIPRVWILDSSSGAPLGHAVESDKSDIMTRGNFSARNGDKFLVAHRTGMVDVYQVSPDGKKITKYWEF